MTIMITSALPDTATLPLEYNNSQSTMFVGWPVNEAARVVFIMIGSMEVVSGVVGNLLLLTVLLTDRSLIMRSFHYLFIANLAMADLLCLGYWMPFFVFDLILGRHPVANEAHCAFNGFVIYVCLAVSVLSLTSISLNRYLHVCHHHLYSRVFSLPRVIVWCLLLWVVAVALCIPPFFGVSMYGYHGKSHTCSYDRHINAMYIDASSGFFCIVPMVFVGYWNYVIFRYWRQNKLDLDNRYLAIKEEQQNISLTVSKNVDGNENQPREKGDTAENKQMGTEPASGEAKDSVSQVEQTTDQYNATMKQFHIRMKKELAKEQAFVRSLLVVFLLMVLCFLPYGVTMIIVLIDPTYEMNAEYSIATIVMVFFNCSINWIVYGVMNRSFRRYYVMLVRRVLGTCCRCPWPRRLWTRSTTEAQGNANASGTGTSDSAAGVDFATAQSTTV